MSREHRNTIFVEDARILSHDHYDGDQWVLRIEAPKLAARAAAGSFAHIQCDPGLAMRRPLSVMRADPTAGWAEFLYKIVGKGTALLAQKKVGDSLSVMGPVGQGFAAHSSRPRALLLGGGVGIPPMVFLADQLRRSGAHLPFVVMGSEVPFPFTTRPSQIMVPGMPDGVIACMPLMEDWGIASRLTSLQGYAGCHDGYVTDLARAWLDALDTMQRAEVAIYACGPTPMLKAVADVATSYGLPCQVSLEEFMACAVGGCAGCVVRVTDGQDEAMKRVCVDGPVFESDTVLWNALPS
jgi:dihydroorotate dehydrogenase electron transfer subunit